MRHVPLILLVYSTVGVPRVDAQTSRAITRAARSSLAADARALLKRDLARDLATASKRLLKPRRVFRFTTTERALREAKRGLPPGTHMTSKAGPGRALSAITAAKKFGLSRTPSVRELIELPRGTAIRLNKALRGWRGVGELTSPRPVPPSAIKKVIPLRKQ